MAPRHAFFLAAILSVLLACTATPPANGAPGRIEITVDGESSGFDPSEIQVKEGEKTILVFTRKGEKGCGKEVVLFPGEKKEIRKSLPLNEPVAIEAVFSGPGPLRYTCGMGMYRGQILVR
ncbi:MAG: cupredoxin domain-containing protein [Bdellovibrionota bacterium]